MADDAARFSSLAASLGSLPNLRKHHWDRENRGFFDWGYHTDDLALEWRYVFDDETGYPVDRELVRVLRRRAAEDPCPSSGVPRCAASPASVARPLPHDVAAAASASLK